MRTSPCPIVDVPISRDVTAVSPVVRPFDVLEVVRIGVLAGVALILRIEVVAELILARLPFVSPRPSQREPTVSRRIVGVPQQLLGV